MASPIHRPGFAKGALDSIDDFLGASKPQDAITGGVNLGLKGIEDFGVFWAQVASDPGLYAASLGLIDPTERELREAAAIEFQRQRQVRGEQTPPWLSRDFTPGEKELGDALIGKAADVVGPAWDAYSEKYPHAADSVAGYFQDPSVQIALESIPGLAGASMGRRALFDRLERQPPSPAAPWGTPQLPPPSKTNAPRGQKGIFAGTSSLRNIPNEGVMTSHGRRNGTQLAEALQQAKELMMQSTDPRQIWESTGWMMGPDAEWRYEIDDSQMQFLEQHQDPGNEYMYDGTSLSDIIQHDELFKAYPDLAETPFTMENYAGTEDAGGMYNAGSEPPLTESIMVHGTENSPKYGPGLGPKELLEVILHEIQHGVQEREGFEPGTAPSRMGVQTLDPEQSSEAVKDWNHYLIQRGYPGDLVNPKFADVYRADFTDKNDVEDMITEQGAWLMDNAGMMEPDVDGLYQSTGINEMMLNLLSPEEMYLRNWGEMEARNAGEYRFYMPPDEMRSTHPYDSMDRDSEQAWVTTDEGRKPGISQMTKKGSGDVVDLQEYKADRALDELESAMLGDPDNINQAREMSGALYNLPREDLEWLGGQFMDGEIDDLDNEMLARELAQFGMPRVLETLANKKRGLEPSPSQLDDRDVGNQLEDQNFDPPEWEAELPAQSDRLEKLQPYIETVVNKSWAAGSNPKDVIKELAADDDYFNTLSDDTEFMEAVELNLNPNSPYKTDWQRENPRYNSPIGAISRVMQNIIDTHGTDSLDEMETFRLLERFRDDLDSGEEKWGIRNGQDVIDEIIDTPSLLTSMQEALNTGKVPEIKGLQPTNPGGSGSSSQDPLRVYHGTFGGQFENLQPGRAGLAFTAMNRNMAKDYAGGDLQDSRIMAFDANPQNPADLRDPAVLQQFVEAFNNSGGFGQLEDSDRADNPDYDPKTDAQWELLDVLGSTYLSDMGYDSVIYNEYLTGGENYGMALATQFPDQVLQNVEDTTKYGLDGRPEGWVSQRFPTAKTKTEDPLEEALISDVNALRQNPEQFGAAVGVLQQSMADPDVPGSYQFREDIRNIQDPEEALEAMLPQMERNLEWLYETAPSEIRQGAPDWYPGANKWLNSKAVQTGLDPMQVSGITAALSPQAFWDVNVARADRIIDTLMNEQNTPWSRGMSRRVNIFLEQIKARSNTPGKMKNYEMNKALVDRVRGRKLNELSDPVERALWIRFYDEQFNTRDFMAYGPDGKAVGLSMTDSGNPRKMNWGTFGSMAKAVSMFDDGSYDNISTQLGNAHKIRNFNNNMLHPNYTGQDKKFMYRGQPDQDVQHADLTMDTHAIAADLLSPFGGSSIPVAQNLSGKHGAGSSAFTGVQGTYPLHRQSYINVADKKNLIPHAVQSITWEAVRALFNNKSPKMKRAAAELWREYNLGNISESKLRDKIHELNNGYELPQWAK